MNQNSVLDQKAYTWVEWKEKFKAEAKDDKQKQHDLDCTALVTLDEAQKLEDELKEKFASIDNEVLKRANQRYSKAEAKIEETKKLEKELKTEIWSLEHFNPELIETRKELDQAKRESASFKKQLGYVVEDRGKLEKQIAEVNKIIDDKIKEQESTKVPMDYKITFDWNEMKRLRLCLMLKETKEAK